MHFYHCSGKDRLVKQNENGVFLKQIESRRKFSIPINASHSMIMTSLFSKKYAQWSSEYIDIEKQDYVILAFCGSKHDNDNAQ